MSLFVIETDGTERVAQALVQAAERLSNTQPLMRELGENMAANVSERIAKTKTDPAGRKWPDIKPRTRARYKAKGISGSLMRRKGNLLGSVTSNVLDAASVQWGVSAEYGLYHIFGTEHMAVRNMVFGAIAGQGLSASVAQELSASDEQDIMDLLLAHIDRAMP